MLRETRYIAGCALVMSVVMQIVFIVLGLWDASVLLGNLLAQRGALFIHHHNQVAEGAFGQNPLDLIQREALPLEALDDAQPLHIRDGKAPKAAGGGSIRRKQPFFLVITQGFRGEAVGDGKRADGYFHAIRS